MACIYVTEQVCGVPVAVKRVSGSSGSEITGGCEHHVDAENWAWIQQVLVTAEPSLQPLFSVFVSLNFIDFYSLSVAPRQSAGFSKMLPSVLRWLPFSPCLEECWTHPWWLITMRMNATLLDLPYVKITFLWSLPRKRQSSILPENVTPEDDRHNGFKHQLWKGVDLQVWLSSRWPGNGETDSSMTMQQDACTRNYQADIC